MEERVKKIQAQFEKQKINAFVTFKKSHIRYLTGVRVLSDGDAILIITEDKMSLLTHFIYQEEAMEKAPDITEIPQNAYKRAIEILTPEKFVGFDSETSLGYFLKFKREPVSIEGLIENVSAVKDHSEIVNIRKALDITEMVFAEKIIPMIKPGIREQDIAAAITYWHKIYGAEGDAFPPIVLAGANSSKPHGIPGETKLKIGDLLQFDIGCIVNGYCSDFSRVVVVGTEPTEKQERIYNIVLEAQLKAIMAARIGMRYIDLDAAARNHIAAAGYGENFGHSLGHGVGIEIHTPPWITPNPTRDSIMVPWQVFTVEPGIYIPSWGGIRIEDMVLTTASGIIVLTKHHKDLVKAG